MIDEAPDTRLTIVRLILFIILGLCSWGVIIGLVLAIIAPNGFPGVLIVTISIGLGASILSWLVHDANEDR